MWGGGRGEVGGKLNNSYTLTKDVCLYSLRVFIYTVHTPTHCTGNIPASLLKHYRQPTYHATVWRIAYAIGLVAAVCER